MKLHQGQATGLVEPLDKRVALYLKEIIRKGCRRVKELQSKGSEFVREKVFHGERPPESLRSNSNTNWKKVRNLITRIKLKHIIPKLIQKILLNKQRNRQDGTKSSFHCGRLVLCVQRFALEIIEATDKRHIQYFLISNVVYHSMFYIIFSVKVVLAASRQCYS